MKTMKMMMTLIAVAGLVLALTPAAQASNLALAPGGTAIIGGNTVDNGSRGDDFVQFSPPDEINDGIKTDHNRETTYGYAGDYDWAGIEFAAPVAGINQILWYQWAGGDGGWFSDGTITTSDDHLEAPKVQITTDGGTTWTDVAGVTDDYLAVLQDTGQIPGDPILLKPVVTFDFSAQGPIDGIRLFGQGGGTGDGGFLGVCEMEVYANPGPPSGTMFIVK